MYSSNPLRRRLLQEPNLTLEKVAKKAQAFEFGNLDLLKSNRLLYNRKKMQVGMVRLKVTQDKYDFPSNKCFFHCGSSIHFANKSKIAKGRSC